MQSDNEEMVLFPEVKVTGYHKCTYKPCHFCLVQDLAFSTSALWTWNSNLSWQCEFS